MLKRNWALIALVYLAIAEILSWSPVPDLALCLIQPEYSEQAADHNEPKYCPAFHTGVEVFFAAANDVFERYEKLIIGGFTVVLAISTIGLWLATKRLWDAGERQLALLAETSAGQSRDMRDSISAAKASAKAAQDSADALPRVERAYVYPTMVSSRNIKECIETAREFNPGGHDSGNEPVPATMATLTFRLKNYGKTPAVLKSVYAGFGVSPEGSEFGVTVPDSILGSMETTGDIAVKMNALLTRNQASGIGVYTASLGFSGLITFEDIWGSEHVTDFYFKWDQEAERMA